MSTDGPAEDGRTRILDTRQPPKQGRPKGELIVRAGPVTGLQFTLHKGIVVVGRSGQCDCALPDEAVSRRHFELHLTPAGVQLRDLGSGNGTLVNGERTDEVMLANGDKIAVGDSILEFRERSAKASGSTPVAGVDSDAEPRTWFLSRLPAQPRRLLAAASVALLVIVIFLALTSVQKRRQAEVMRAVHAFQQGRQELAADPPDPDAALSDFQAALRKYPDPQMVREAISDAQNQAAGMQQLSHARELLDQKDLPRARKQLLGLPKGDYFTKASKSIGDEIDKKDAAQRAQLAAEAAATVDPTTLAEAHDLWERAKQHESSAPELSLQEYGQAYDMLTKRSASGAEYDQLKLEAAEFMLKQAKVLRRRNPVRAATLTERARVLSPETVAAVENPPPTPVLRPVTHAPASASKHKRHHSAMAASAAKPAAPAARGSPAASKAPPAHYPAHYDDDRADQLCDDGDALIGQDPSDAKRKYSEALKFARPGGHAAQRAQEGLSN